MADPMSILEIVLAVVLGGALLLCGKHWSSGWRGESKSGARLPKGSLGWPFIGETLDFARNSDTYCSSHIERYGKIFKTSLFLQPTILGTTPDFAKFVTSTNSHLFVSGLPDTMAKIIGSKSIMFEFGPRHMPIKKVIQKAILGPETLRAKFSTLEAIILDNMASWEQRGTINGKEGTEGITMNVSIWLLLGIRDILSTPEGRLFAENFHYFDEGLFSLPVNLPGTGFNKGLKARANLTKYLKSLLQKRKGQENPQGDMLGALLAAREDPQAPEEVRDLDDDTVVDNLVFYWYAAFDTTATSLLWILKFLKDYPEVLRRIQAEQQEILKGKDPSANGPRLSWEDTRKMVYAQQFFQEVQRTVSVTNLYMLRKATQDVEYDGFLIPKNWVVGYMSKGTHGDPGIYSDPSTFNPDRFDATPKPHTYMPFSAGAHMCAGAELAKLIALIFIHHATTTYTYESAAPDKGIEYKPFKRPIGGYPITICRRN